MFKVEARGFKTREQAEKFVDWYTSHGEFDLRDWFNTFENKDLSQAQTDSTTFPFKWQDDTLPMILNVS